MKPAFNSDYYTAAATIIPVLYVALTFQGSTFEESLKRYSESVNPGVQTAKPGISSRARVTGSLAITLLIGAILVFGILAEFTAVLALYQQRAGQVAPLVVMIAISLLLILVASVPVVRFCGTLYRMVRSDYG